MTNEFALILYANTRVLAGIFGCSGQVPGFTDGILVALVSSIKLNEQRVMVDTKRNWYNVWLGSFPQRFPCSASYVQRRPVLLLCGTNGDIILLGLSLFATAHLEAIVIGVVRA